MVFGVRRRRHRPATGGVAIETGSASATGPRLENQDRVTVTARWAIVTDGAGGHAGGATAAELALDGARGALEEEGDLSGGALAAEAVQVANRAVRAGRTDPATPDMAATITLALAAPEPDEPAAWVVANLGDSPAWLVRPGRARRLTREDNLAAELVRQGLLSTSAARHHRGRNVITRATGMHEAAEPTLTRVVLAPGDCLVVASDGLEVIDETELQRVFTAPDPVTAARLLVDRALASGASDNVTVAVVRRRPG